MGSQTNLLRVCERACADDAGAGICPPPATSGGSVRIAQESNSTNYDNLMYPIALTLQEQQAGGLYCSIFGSYHPGVCQFLLCDGSVRTFNNQTSLQILSLYANRSDGEPIPRE